jgi:cyclic lactone autoinducer peptide
MKNENKKLTTKLCKAALRRSMGSISKVDCTWIFYEPKQPKQLENVDLEQLKKSIRTSR